MKRYNFNGTHNTRDLGGYPTYEGKYTKYNNLIRSDVPLKLDDNDIKLLLDLKITTVIDIRETHVSKRSPNCLIENSLFSCFNFPLESNFGCVKTENEYINILINIASEKEVMSQIMKTISNAKDGIFFHCKEGKDRTGIISALLLSLVGVVKEDILADYQVSSSYFIDYIKIIKDNEKTMANQMGFGDKLPEFILYTKAEYMDKFLILFNEKFISVENYMKFLGLTNEDIFKIKSKLID